MKETTDNSSTSISDLFGTISQIAWLFAQLPQVWQNYRTKSVDGLALPFLLSWLLGDLTNLLGCLLTDQLPFQRNLAIYFTLVDLILVYQFRTYSTPISPDYQALAHHDPNSLSQSLSYSNETETPEERWRRHLRQVSAAQLESPGGLAREYTRSMSRKGRLRQSSSQSMGGGGGAMDASFLSTKSDQTPISNVGPTSGGTVVRSPTYDERGRSLARSNHARLAPLSTTTKIWNANEHDRSISNGGMITSPPKSPQTSVLPSIAFLGIFTFLVFNTVKIYPTETLSGMSRAWDNRILAHNPMNHDSAPIMDQVLKKRSLSTLDQRLIKPFDWQRLIGRISAWLCAILYLTSRLPQIWKNFCRKSVEGLSITLFVMAFLGNLTYVISVLSSPKVTEQVGYLAESFPYLIGSGGTLCFDFTIFIQSKIYSLNRLPRRKRTRTISRSASRRRRTIDVGDLDIEQQTALLSPISPPAHLSLVTPSHSGLRTESNKIEGSRQIISPNQLRDSQDVNIVTSPVEEQEIILSKMSSNSET
ncbi:PQ loop repeat-domain-containing protein [Melampsora americana]|nr:PQ loop repeat-domain-containing protein [Melampsora americana]